MVVLFKDLQTRLSRGRRSRNKVSVGEPAEGSFLIIYQWFILCAKNNFLYMCILQCIFFILIYPYMAEIRWYKVDKMKIC